MLNSAPDNKGKMEIVAIHLSVAELAFSLGMINRPDLGLGLMKQFFSEASDAEIYALLTGAAHALMARNLCQYIDPGRFHLAQRLEYLVFPLALYDGVVRISWTMNGKTSDAVVYLQRNKRRLCFLHQ